MNKIIECKGNFESIDVNRVFNDVIWDDEDFYKSIIRIPVIAWAVDEETGKCLPVLLNGVKAKIDDIVINTDTLIWNCGHDRGVGNDSMIEYIKREFNANIRRKRAKESWFRGTKNDREVS